MDNIFVTSSAKAGLIIGGISVLFSMLTYLTGVNVFNFAFLGINFLVSLALMILPVIWFGRQYRDKFKGGYMSYGQALMFGIMSILTASVIVAVYHIIFNSLVSSDYMLEMADNFMTKMSEMPGMTDEILDKTYNDILKQINASAYKKAIQAFTSFALMGGVMSLISAAFIKKQEEIFN